MTVIEGMGFTAAEAKQILLKEPLVFMQKFEEKLRTNFELLHTQVIRKAKWFKSGFKTSGKKTNESPGLFYHFHFGNTSDSVKP